MDPGKKWIALVIGLASAECLEIICVEKAVTEAESTQPETAEKLYEAFRAHVKLKHAEDFSQAA